MVFLKSDLVSLVSSLLTYIISSPESFEHKIHAVAQRAAREKTFFHLAGKDPETSSTQGLADMWNQQMHWATTQLYTKAIPTRALATTYSCCEAPYEYQVGFVRRPGICRGSNTSKLSDRPWNHLLRCICWKAVLYRGKLLKGVWWEHQYII